MASVVKILLNKEEYIIYYFILIVLRNMSHTIYDTDGIARTSSKRNISRTNGKKDMKQKPWEENLQYNAMMFVFHTPNYPSKLSSQQPGSPRQQPGNLLPPQCRGPECGRP